MEDLIETVAMESAAAALEWVSVSSGAYLKASRQASVGAGLTEEVAYLPLGGLVEQFLLLLGR